MLVVVVVVIVVIVVVIVLQLHRTLGLEAPGTVKLELHLVRLAPPWRKRKRSWVNGERDKTTHAMKVMKAVKMKAMKTTHAMNTKKNAKTKNANKRVLL